MKRLATIYVMLPHLSMFSVVTRRPFLMCDGLVIKKSYLRKDFCYISFLISSSHQSFAARQTAL